MESREQERQATRRTVVLGGEQQSGRLTKKGVDESPSPSGRESKTKHEASRIRCRSKEPLDSTRPYILKYGIRQQWHGALRGEQMAQGAGRTPASKPSVKIHIAPGTSQCGIIPIQ
jgi:hypothetical protein